MSTSASTAGSGASANAPVVVLAGRVLLSILFITAGFGKLTSIAGTAGFMGSLGLPLPPVTAVVVGLIELVGNELTAAGVEILTHHPYFNIPEGAGADVKGAVYNYKFATSGGAASHNFVYTVAALQLSYEKLAGEPVPNADMMQ